MSIIMPDVHLYYLRTKPSGIEPNSVAIFATLTPMKFQEFPEENPDDNTLFSLQKIIKTEDTPREVLNKLEGLIFGSLSRHPSAVDALWKQPQDTCKEYENCSRHMTYLAEGSWPKIGETPQEATARADRATNERNIGLLEIYTCFSYS